MGNVKIISDSCCDLTKELRDAKGIDYVKMNVVIRGEEKPADLDWPLFTPKEFYDIMRGGERITTTQVPATEFIEVFTKYLEHGMDIVYIACSGVLSGSVNTGMVVARDLMEKYPERTIICIDAKNSCYGEGIQAMIAADMAAEGKSAKEIADYITDMQLKVNQIAAPDSLEYLKRAGRVKASSAFFGNIFGVKPMLISDANGQNYAIKKVKGRLNSLKEIVAMLKDAIEKAQDQIVYIVHADCLEEAIKLEEMIKQEIAPKGTHIAVLGPIIGASVGPGTLAAYCVGKKVEITAVGE